MPARPHSPASYLSSSSAPAKREHFCLATSAGVIYEGRTDVDQPGHGMRLMRAKTNTRTLGRRHRWRPDMLLGAFAPGVLKAGNGQEDGPEAADHLALRQSGTRKSAPKSARAARPLMRSSAPAATDFPQSGEQRPVLFPASSGVPSMSAPPPSTTEMKHGGRCMRWRASRS